MTDDSKQKQLWFHIYSDYRTGATIDVYTDDAPDDALEITFALPKQGRRLYLMNEYPTYNTEPIWSKDLSEDDDHEKIYKKIFSQIHGCLPFEVTGYNSAYKEEGHYPEIPEEIKLFKEIDIPDIDEDGVYFVCVMDTEGNEIFTGMN
jgi:hypothetical protein